MMSSRGLKPAVIKMCINDVDDTLDTWVTMSFHGRASNNFIVIDMLRENFAVVK